VIVTDLSVRHRTTVYVLMVLIVIVGAWSYVSMPRESSPDIKIPFMNIVTIYPGVAPGDVETLLTVPIENELKNLRDVEKVTSVSAEGVSVITIEFQPSVDLDFALQRVKEKVDTAKADLPEDAEDPMVQEINFSDFPIMQVNVTGDVGLVRLKQIADDLQDRIEGIPGVLRVEVIGGLEREIHVEFNPERLASYGLSPQAVVGAIQAANVNVPAGNLELGEANYSLRVPGEFEEPQEIAGLVVTRREGRPVYVRDVATVVDGHKDVETLSRYNGVPSVSLSIQKRAGENIVRICDEVRRLLAEERGRLPAGVQVPLAFDESRNIRRMVADLENSMANGFILVVGVILFFMGLMNSLFVGLAIPFSMLISFGVLHAMGYTLNIIVLFSLILSLGMLVDNAIVIVDNIYRHMQGGQTRVQAAIDGTAEVAWPVTTSTLTTVAAFFPMLFWPGIMGEFMSYLPATLIVTLAASLFVALVINPVLCASFMRVDPKRLRAAGGRENPFMRGYERVLAFSIDRYKTSIAVGFAALVAIIAIYGKFGKGVEFFPAIESTRAQITVKTPRGTSLATTDLVTRRAEEAAKCCENVDYIIADVGAGGAGFFVGEGSARPDASRVSVYFREWEKLVEPASRTLGRIRAAVDQEIVGAEVIVEEEQHGPPTGQPVNLEISGEDFASLKGVADRVRAAIKDVPGVVDLEDDYDQGRPEIRVRVDKERAELLGLATVDIALAVRAAVNGVKAGVFREGDEEYDITVRLPKAERSSLDALSHMTLAGRTGQVPLSAVARLEMGSGFGSIRRIDQKRVVTVSSDVLGRLAEEVRADVAAAVAKLPLPPKTAIGFTGEQEEQAKNQRFLGRVFVVALLLISLILVAQFDSLKYVLIIMLTVPLSLLGVFLGLLTTGTTFIVIMTGIGVISLAGVVVNNAIVLLDFVRSARREGLPVREALIASGKVRLRPVFLTAVTTILGLVPMATGLDFDFRSLSFITNSESSQWWKSMSIAVIFGLTVATVLTLVMVPTFYRAFFGTGKGREPAVEATGGTDHG
jgi:multidrug efflux pump